MKKLLSVFILVLAILGAQVHPDEIYIAWSPVADLSPAGVVKVRDGHFVLDEQAWFNKCHRAADAGANCLRILPFGVWGFDGHENAVNPYKYAGDGKWNLDLWNEEYFIVLKQMVGIANHPAQGPPVEGQIGLTVIFDLLDNCQFFGNNPYSPWSHNTQGIASFYDERAYPYVKTWIERITRELSGLDVFLGMGNELAAEGRWLAKNLLMPVLRDLKWPTEKLAYGASMTMNPVDTLGLMKADAELVWGNEPDKLKIFRPVHSCLAPAATAERPFGEYFHQALEWWGNHPIRIILSDDGVWTGDSDCDLTPALPPYVLIQQVRPSDSRWYKGVKYLLDQYRTKWQGYGLDGLNLLMVEHLYKNPDMNCQQKTLDAISRAYKEKFNRWPANYGKFPLDWVKPECGPQDVQTITCWNGQEIVTHICKDGKWQETGEQCPPQPKRKTWLQRLWESIVKFFKRIF